MRLTKQIGAIVGATGLAAAMMLAGPAYAATAINGTGTVGCNITSGSASINPPLVNGGTATSVAIKVKIGLACTSGTADGATVTSAKVSGTLHSSSNDCANLLGNTAVTGSLTSKWKVTKGSPKLNPSTLGISSITGGTSGANASFSITGSVNSGSFNGDSVNASATTNQTLADLGAACGGKGIKKITFSNGSANLS